MLAAGDWLAAARRLPSRTPLRVKLITAVLALVAIALVVISVAGLGFLRNYLLGQYEGQLQAYAEVTSNGGVPGSGLPREVRSYLFSGQGQVQGLVLGWLPDGAGSVQWLVRNAAVVSEPGLSPPPVLPNPSVQPGAGWLDGDSSPVVSATSGGTRYLMLAVPGVPVGVPGSPAGTVTGTVIIGLDVTSVYKTLGKLTAIDVLVSAGLLLSVGVIGVTVIRRSLRPLTDVEQTAEAIAAGDLTRRVPEHDPQTEVGRLGRSLNVMLAQIEAAFRDRSASEAAARRSEDKMRQFIADASHELRTPLTAIRGFAEYYRQRGGVDLGAGPAGGLATAELDRIMRRVEQEASRMGILVEDLLLLARMDQQRPLEHRTVDLLTLAADAVHDARVVAPGRDIHLTVAGGKALLVLGDEVRLRQVIGNLMSNALAHTPDGTPIDVLIRPGNLDEARAAGQRALQAAAVTALAGAAPARPVWRAIPAGPGAAEAGSAEAGPAGGREWRFVPAGNQEPSDTITLGPPEDTEPAGENGQPTTGNGATAGGFGSASTPADGVPVIPDLAGGPLAAVLEVTDHGPGLSREQAEHVFERFYRADQARTSGGTGLGLAIVAALTAAHGGAVWVDSEPGHGATFRIALPLAPEALTDDDPDAEYLGDPAPAPPPAAWTVRPPARDEP